MCPPILSPDLKDSYGHPSQGRVSRSLLQWLVRRTAMLLGSVPCGHSDDVVVSFGKDYVLERVVVVGMAVCRGDDVGESPTVHELNEPLGYRIEVASEYQPFFECGFGGAIDDRMSVHVNQTILDLSLGNVKKRDLAPDLALVCSKRLKKKPEPPTGRS